MQANERFDVLLFWSFDKLLRESVLETLQRLNRPISYRIRWRSFGKQYLDSTSVFRDAVIGVLAALAKQEKIRIRERNKAGRERARREGKILGRPKVEVDPTIIRTLPLQAVYNSAHAEIRVGTLCRVSAGVFASSISGAFLKSQHE
jgi:DNA invertase Pin-like site-specific DNA recombinase